MLGMLMCSTLQRGMPPVARRLVSTAPRAVVVAAAQAGDVASVTYSLSPNMESRAASYGENANMLIDSLPFDTGDVRFVIGRGGYLDGLHSTVAQMAVGEKKTGVSIDAGAGDFNPEGVITVPADKAPQGLKKGMAVMLQLGSGQQAQATVTEQSDESVTLDTNHPLAGCRMLMDVELTAVEPASAFETATFAGGCFSLSVRISDEYPFRPPLITFDAPSVPYHANVSE